LILVLEPEIYRFALSATCFAAMMLTNKAPSAKLSNPHSRQPAMQTPALSVIKSDQPEKWQEILSDLITDPKELLANLKLDTTANPLAALAAKGLAQFPLKVPRPFAARIEPGNWDDPLLRQVWPGSLEDVESDSLSLDPLQETHFNKTPGLLQKYHGRVLLTAAPHCAVHCRYCFRRHFDYAANTPGRREWSESIAYISENPDISEVILSGGDPLAAGDGYLAWLLAEVDRIPHVETIRIHSRLPIVIPQRVTAQLCSMLSELRSKSVFITHCNHAQEIDGEVQAALQAIRHAGSTLLNQAVLLKGVNDYADSLIKLSTTLFQSDVLPYYLHLPDRVAGTGHFIVNESEALKLMASVRSHLPGYLVPQLVREDPGNNSKTRLA